jgi:hypothetical protein
LKESETSQLTFVPKINKLPTSTPTTTTKINKEHDKENNNNNTENNAAAATDEEEKKEKKKKEVVFNRLSIDSKKKLHELLTKVKDELELKECTFKPTILDNVKVLNRFFILFYFLFFYFFC